jgi:hexosaminidase
MARVPRARQNDTSSDRKGLFSMRSNIRLYPVLATVVIFAAGCATGPQSSAPPVKPGAGPGPEEASMPNPLPPLEVGAVLEDWPLLPAPRSVEMTGSIAGIDAAVSVAVDPYPPVLGTTLRAALAAFPVGPGDASGTVRHRIVIDPAGIPHPQGYRIDLAADDAGAVLSVVAHDEPGLFYAAQTLQQLATLSREKGAVPLCHITDYPDFPNRGLMIDVARDKVPTMETLFGLVDLMASWKYNQLQLYTEHTFAYAGHEVVWKDASPVTPEDARTLDAYCRDRYIQLVPNQNSFGHMGRWLSHPEYAPLAEVPGRNDLCPVDPGAIALIRDLYGQLLPNFSSPYVNIGCDETGTLGDGRSKAAAARQGKGRVYLDFLMKIREVAAVHGKSVQFWADIINNYPSLIPELPDDMVAMEWGYEANHPYASHTQRFRENGVRFYVVPGTSTWNTFLGRTDNALANMRSAAEHGIANGGEGFLLTDWGDGGHWQFQPVSYLPFVFGAGVSWCFETNRYMDSAEMADRYAFFDAAGVMGGVARDLGNAHLESGVETANRAIYYQIMTRYLERPLNRDGLQQLTAENLERTAAAIDNCLGRLDDADLQGADAAQILTEYRLNAALAKFSCRLGIARIRAGRVATSEMPAAQRHALAEELEPLIAEYRELWLARNRPGGLQDSAGRLEESLALLKS